MVQTKIYLSTVIYLCSTTIAAIAPIQHAHYNRAVSTTTTPIATVAAATSSSTTKASGVISTISAATGPATSSSTSVTGPILSYGGTIPVGLSSIGTATTVEVTQTLPSTYAAGSTPPVKGAPPLPAITSLNPANYPALDKQPPTNSSQVLQWISEINLAGAPNIPVTAPGGCLNTTYNAAAIASAGAAGNCWWTCGGCTRATDVSYCPQKNTWGLSYDDGPSPYTPRLLNLLSVHNIKATFFIVGSRAISRPQMIQTEYMQGHQLSVHTWAHPYLTQMTNEQIVAELGWTRKIIKDITGVTPNTMRPPYGDIDDRVRYISLQMGMTPVIWTSYSGNTFDTRDWQIGAGVVNATSVYANFENYLGLATSTFTNGFIVLAHDLYQQSVELAVTYILPEVFAAKVLTMQPIITCLGRDLAEAYMETATNATLPAIETSVTLVGASGTGFVANVAQTSHVDAATATGTSAGSSSSGTPKSAGNVITANLMKVGVAGVLVSLAIILGMGSL